MLTAWLFQKIKEVLSRNVFKKEEVGRRSESTIERDDIWVNRQTGEPLLLAWQLEGGYKGETRGPYLEHLGTQRALVKTGLEQISESIFTTVPRRNGRGGDAIEVYSVGRQEIFGQWWVAGQDLADLVDGGVASIPRALTASNLREGVLRSPPPL